MSVNLSPLGGAGQQFFDNNGNPLSGGKLYSYAAGTTTPQATYTSVSGAIAHTNPIILDSAGRVATGEIWVTAGQNYKFVLKTTTETTIATWDNITGINGTGIATDAEFVGYTAQYSGAVAYTVEDKLSQYISLLDFGADPTGATNSTTAWNNFQAASTGGKLIPAGSYLVNSLTRVYPNNVIEDNIQLFPPGYVGTESRAVENSFFQDKAAGRVGMSDTTPTDDNGAGASLPSTNWWGDLANVGIGSFAANRNGAAYGTYASCFGHDCVSYGTAGIAGGAGSAAGSPSTGAGGYCSIAVGKNVWAAGDKSASFCEESRSLGRADFTAGYSAATGATGIGKIALGYRVQAGLTTGVDGTVAIGNNVVSNNGAIIIGRGINDGSQLNSSFANEIGFGSNVLKPTFGVLPGDGTPSGVGSIYSRAPITMIGPVDATPDLTLGQITSVTNNSGAGGSSIMTFGIRVTGTLTDVCAVDYSIGSALSFIPVTDASANLGAASRRWSVVYAATGTINTSDGNQKQDVEDLSAKELAVAKSIKGLIKKFKFKDAVKAKGDDARIHVGVIAQDVKAAFEAEGLDATEYALFCSDILEDGTTQLGIRYDELLAFVIASL